MSFVSTWQTLIGHLPSGPLSVLAIIGVAVLVIFVLVWIFQSRRGGGFSAKSFPWWALVVAAILAGPQVTVPVILTILQAIITIILNIVNWAAHLLG